MIQTKLVADGTSADDAEAKVAEMVKAGDIKGPAAPTMFFAPQASNEVVGGSFALVRETPGFPFVVEAGTHSYIVTFTERSAETDQVLQNCSGQIDLTTASAAAN
jgi:hypothetical protein